MNPDTDYNSELNVSWININSGTQAMAQHILHHDIPDAIIATQEDIITAALVCNIINVPLCTAHLKKRQRGIIIDCMPKINTPIHSGVYEQFPLPSIGIISTLIDNNHNVDKLVEYYTKSGHKVKTLCIYTRKLVDNPPDYNWVKLTDVTNCIFPWQEK